MCTWILILLAVSKLGEARQEALRCPEALQVLGGLGERLGDVTLGTHGRNGPRGATQGEALEHT